MNTCRSCHAPIVWAVTTTGKRIPVDRDPNPYGNITLQDQGPGVAPLAVVHTPRRLPLRVALEMRTAHHSTCPDAVLWRKGRQ